MTFVRKNVGKLGAGWNDTLHWYAIGVRALQARPLADLTSWRFLGAIHGIHPAVWRAFGYYEVDEPLPAEAAIERYWRQCQHQTWFFLPWHRAYIAAFEWIVRAAIVGEGGPADWALPYWNYSDAALPSGRQLPGAFAEEHMPDGSDNPLYVSRRYGSGTSPIIIPPEDADLGALAHDDFEGGANQIPPGFGGPDTDFHHGDESETDNGGIEAVPHNQIHGAIGGVIPGTDPNDWANLGLMSMPITAGLDPIFWLHHSNIDRLWSIWLKGEAHKNPDAAGWLDGPADRLFALPRADGSEWQFSARDLLDTRSEPLSYEYEEEEALPEEPRILRRLRKLGVDAAGVAPPGGEPMARRGKAELIGASETPVRVTGVTSAAVRVDESGRAKLKSSLSRLAAGAAAGADRVFLKLEGITGTSDAANYRVYVDLPGGADPADYPHLYAGSISLFGVSEASDAQGPRAGNGINQVLEITEIVDALHLSGDALERLKLQFVPANPNVAAADFSIRKVSLFRLGAGDE